ncbi:MAG: hypothetical protein NUV92_04405 [Ignavibacteria bacterium]|jgi:hypothetical protein|nr:hypothetical protein [Ignavibacteria bacterium]MDH7526743.1 hypothetical protein [Ignavibacteria bacterium]
MENKGYLEIAVTGRKGNIELSIENFDIKEISLLFEQVEKLLFPNGRKEGTVISYQIKEGSVINRFQTSLQSIIGLNAILHQIKENGNIDFLEPNTANAIETIQDLAKKTNYEFVVSTSLENTATLKITNETFYFRTAENFVDAEFYLFGKITGAGGKDRSSIHLLTEEYGTLVIQVSKEYLMELKKNILYKDYIIRTSGKQNLKTGEIDRQNLKMIEMIDYSSEYNEKYLKLLREKAMKWLKDIDTDDYIKNVRGY